MLYTYLLLTYHQGVKRLKNKFIGKKQKTGRKGQSHTPRRSDRSNNRRENTPSNSFELKGLENAVTIFSDCSLYVMNEYT